MTERSRRCQQSWSPIRRNCCGGDCVCTPTGMRITPIHSPFGREVYGIFTGASTGGDSEVSSQALAVSEDRIPLWEEGFKHLALVAAGVLDVDVENLSLEQFIDFIKQYLNIELDDIDENAEEELKEAEEELAALLQLSDPSEEEKDQITELQALIPDLKEKVKQVQLQRIFNEILDRLEERIGSAGRIWWFMNDESGLRWWDWVCYEEMLGSRFDRENVLHKYDRQLEQGKIAYKRLGVSRHTIQSLGPCELYWIVANARGASTCFFSPYRFLEIANLPDPLRLTGTFSVSWSWENNRPPANLVDWNNFAWNDGDPLFGDGAGSGSIFNQWTEEDEEERVDRSGGVTDHSTGEIMLPPQITDVIIYDPYHFCFTPSYIQFNWTRHDITCKEYDDNGNLINCKERVEGEEASADNCIKHVRSYYEAWTGDVVDITRTWYEQVEIIDRDGFFWGSIFGSVIDQFVGLDQYYLGWELRSQVVGQERVGVWGNTNALLNDVYFNCNHPARWVNIKITDYPIQPGKKEWGPGEGTWEGVEHGITYTDENTGEEVEVPTAGILVLDDPWACGDRSHLPDSIKLHFQHNIWIATGRAADPDRGVRPEPDRGELVVENAWAYNYKYNVFTNGLLVREPIDQYAPLPHYPDEVEKRNFEEELQIRMEAITRRREEIALRLEELDLRIEILQAQINRRIAILQSELDGNRLRWESLQETYGDIEYEDMDDEFDDAIKLRTQITIRIDELQEELDDLLDIEDPSDDQLEEIRTLENNIRVANEHLTLPGPIRIRDRIEELEAEIEDLTQNGTPEIRNLKNWRTTLRDEDCMLYQPCIEERIEQREQDLRTAELEMAEILRLERDIRRLQLLQIRYTTSRPERDQQIRQLQQRLDDLLAEDPDRIRFLRMLMRDLRVELKNLRRELWKFMTEDERVEAEIAEVQRDIDEIEEEFELWKQHTRDNNGNYSKTDLTTCQEYDPEEDEDDGFCEDGGKHLDRFGPMPNDWCYWMLYQRRTNQYKSRITKLRADLEDAKSVKVLKPYTQQFNTYMWNNMVQEGMAYYKIPVYDEEDTNIKKGRFSNLNRVGIGEGRGINYRTNWDFSWARGFRVAGAEVGRHGIQTSRRKMGGANCLIHYVDKGLKNQEDTVDAELALLEQRVQEIRARLSMLFPGTLEAVQAQTELNRALNDLEILRANPEDAEWKRERIWEEHIIPLADYIPYGIVGRTILNVRGSASPIAPMVTVNDATNISDWRKRNDPQIRDLYESDDSEIDEHNTVTIYKPKDGTDLIHNLIEPDRIRGYNLIKDEKFKWQRKRFRRLIEIDNNGVETVDFEEYWEDDPNFDGTNDPDMDITEFLVWYDGTSFIQKMYLPEEKLGGLLYKAEAHKYVPTLNQRGPINAINTNVEDIFIHNAYFLNRRQAYGSIQCGDGLLSITFFDDNYPVTNPAPRGQVPFWYGEILFAPDVWTPMEEGEDISEVDMQDKHWNVDEEVWFIRRRKRDYFIALKGNSGWICRIDNHRPLVDEIQDFTGFWWHQGENEQEGSYYVKNHYGVGRIVPIQDGGIHIIWLKQSPWRTHLGKIYDKVACKWIDAPWINGIRATVFSGAGAIIGRTNTSGSTWSVHSAIPNILEARDVFPLSSIESFNEAIDDLENEYNELYKAFDTLWWEYIAGADVYDALWDLWDSMADLQEEIDELRKNEPPPLIFFNILRPSINEEFKEIDLQIRELEKDIKLAQSEHRFADVVRFRRQIDTLKLRLADHNRYNIGLMIRKLTNEDRHTNLIANVDYIILERRDKIKRVQLLDDNIFILTSKGKLFRGDMPLDDDDEDEDDWSINPSQFRMKECVIQDQDGNDSKYGAILDFWMEKPDPSDYEEEEAPEFVGRLIYPDMYQTGFTLRIKPAGGGSEGGDDDDSDNWREYYTAEEQRIDKAIDDEPYAGTSCSVLLFDSHYDNPTALVNYKGMIWQLKDKRWEFLDKVQKQWLTAQWNMEFDVAANCRDEGGIGELSTVQGGFCDICLGCMGATFIQENEIAQDLDAEDLPEHNFNYDSLIGDGTLKPSDLIGVNHIPDLDKIVNTLRSASTYSALASVKEFAYFGQNTGFFDNILRGLSITEPSLQFEYIESVRDMLFIELIYNKYFYVRTSRSLWEYNGQSWLEFLHFTNGIPVKSKQHYIEMKCFLDSTGATGIPNRLPDPPPEKDNCCRRCKEERQITEQLDAIEGGTFLQNTIDEINAILGTEFGGVDADTVIPMVDEVRRIIDNPRHPNYPTDSADLGALDRELRLLLELASPTVEQRERIRELQLEIRDWQSADERVLYIDFLLRQITDFLMEGDINHKKSRFILNFTSNLIRTGIIPLFGEFPEFTRLLGTIERAKNNPRFSVTFATAVSWYSHAYALAQSTVSSPAFDMSVGDFFIEPDPCQKPPPLDDPCNCDVKFSRILYLGIQNMFHKPPSDPRKARVLNFFPSLDKDFIVHSDKWSRDYGRTWLEWNNCVGPCSGCFANAEDMGKDLDNVGTGSGGTGGGIDWGDWDNRDPEDDDGGDGGGSGGGGGGSGGGGGGSSLWRNNMWVWEYKITEGAWNIKQCLEYVWSDKNEWWYTRWIIRHDSAWYDSQLESIEAIENRFFRDLVRQYFLGSSQYNDGIHYLMMLGGVLLKTVRVNNNAPAHMNNRDYILTLSPPPNMLRDNTRRREDLLRRLVDLERDISRLETELEAAQQEQNTARILNIEDRLRDLREEMEGVSMFYDGLPQTELYHLTYKFDIIFVP